MLSYCLKCRKNTESKNPKITKKKRGKPLLLSKCAIWASRKSRFFKEQEGRGLLSSLGIRTGLDKALMLGPILFQIYKMNEIMNKFY